VNDGVGVEVVVAELELGAPPTVDTAPLELTVLEA
jgi:hypothetical protein